LPRTYDPEFRRRGVDSVRAVGLWLRWLLSWVLAEATVYRWRAQDLVDRRIRPGTPTQESGELATARRQIRELERSWSWCQRRRRCLRRGLPCSLVVAAAYASNAGPAC
jgi:hypothetical protein